MLSSYRVIDCTDERGQLAGFMLAQLGAEVILVESPGVAFNKTGGRESLGPPDGGMILAQPGPLITLIVMTNMRTADDIKPL